MARANDEVDFYRIPADGRDLNYSKYFTIGEHKIQISEEYNSHNTKRLKVVEIKEALLKLELIQSALNS